MARLAGIAGTTWGLLQARRSADAERLAKVDADSRREEAERQRVRAEVGEKLAEERSRQVAGEKVKVEQQRQKAEDEKRIALAVQDFLQNKLLGQADVWTQADTLRAQGKPSDQTKVNPTIR